MAELKIISMDEVQSKKVNWLWYPYIPYGKITIIQGDPGEGKTTLALRLAALLSKGEPLPYDDTEREPVKIIYQTAEDGLEDTIKPRLEAAEADCTQIKVIDESEAALSMLDERIEKAIIEVGARVVILDPIQAYVGANINMNNANEVTIMCGKFCPNVGTLLSLKTKHGRLVTEVTSVLRLLPKLWVFTKLLCM